MEYMAYVWLAEVVLAIICEASTAALVSIWFIPSGLVSMLLAIFGVNIWIQVVVFFVLSFVNLLLSKTVFKKYLMRGKIEPSGSDALIGEKAVVTKDIDNINWSGEVKIKSQIWSARNSENDEIIPAGAIVTVVAVEGVRLKCKKDL